VWVVIGFGWVSLQFIIHMVSVSTVIVNAVIFLSAVLPDDVRQIIPRSRQGIYKVYVEVNEAVDDVNLVACHTVGILSWALCQNPYVAE